MAASIVAISATLAACGGEASATSSYPDPGPPGEAIVVEHAQGTLTLAQAPKRVYSLDWGVTAVLLALGVEVHGVASNAAPPHLAHLLDDPDVITVGTLHEPCFETIAAHPADLVIIAGRSAIHFEEMAGIAPTIDLTVAGHENVAQSQATALTLGRLFDREAEAEALVARFQATVAEAAALAGDDALIVLTSGSAVSAFGPGGRFGFVHDDFGLAPAALIEEDGRHGQSISFEFILEADPTWLFVIDRDTAIQSGGDAARQVMDNAIIRRTQAYRHNRIVYVDTTSWYIAGTGIVSMQAVADSILELLQTGHAG